MIITNEFMLPDCFVRAVVNDPYDKGDSDFSATGLDVPARAQALINEHKDDLQIDASSRVAAIIGQGAHKIAERAGRVGDIVEERYFARFEVDGETYRVSAQVDLFEQDKGALYDWKTTKAFAFSKKAGGGLKPEWQNQMNVGAEILRLNGYLVKSLTIIAMLKDFEKRRAGVDGYPRTEVVAIEVPLWARDEAKDHIAMRIKAHVKARAELPLCTSEETWQGRRCSGGWCDASSVCSQYQLTKKTGLI